MIIAHFRCCSLRSFASHKGFTPCKWKCGTLILMKKRTGFEEKKLLMIVDLSSFLFLFSHRLFSTVRKKAGNFQRTGSQSTTRNLAGRHTGLFSTAILGLPKTNLCLLTFPLPFHLSCCSFQCRDETVCLSSSESLQAFCV